MTPFAYHRPATVAEAVLLRWREPASAFLAGGQTLIGTLTAGGAHPSALIDVARIPDLAGIRDEGGRLVVGAAATHATIARDAGSLPGLAALARVIGDLQIRNMGTLGGSLANNDPAGEHAAAALGLGADIRTDRRTLPADSFFTGPFRTALGPDELVVAIAYPRPRRAGYAKMRDPASGYPVVGVFAAETADGPRVAVIGAGPRPFRLPAFERALAAGFGPDALAGLTVSAQGLRDSLHASAQYRAHLIAVLARRAVAAAK